MHESKHFSSAQRSWDFLAHSILPGSDSLRTNGMAGMISGNKTTLEQMLIEMDKTTEQVEPENTIQRSTEVDKEEGL